MVPPKSDYRAQLKRLYLQQSWTELIELTDSLFVEGVNHFWLDVQWYLHQALTRAGSPWDKNAGIIISDLKMLLHRMPGLETLAFNDGTPFADDVTREWIARDVLQESDWQMEKIAAASAGADDDILLLESEALTLADSLKHLPDYGLPDMTKILQGMPGTAHQLISTLSQVLLKYEPRLKDIQVTMQEQEMPGHLRYSIDAELHDLGIVRYGTDFTPEGRVLIRHLKKQGWLETGVY